MKSNRKSGESKTWSMYFSLDEIHIVPDKDRHIHEFGSKCLCKPKVEMAIAQFGPYHEHILTFIHKAWDKRKPYIEFKEDMKKERLVN